MLPFSFEDTLT